MRSNCLIVRAHPAWYGVCGGSSGMRPEECSVDSLVEERPEPARAPRPEPPGPRARVKGRDQFSLLIVRGDGTKVVRFNFTRPVARGAFAGVALALSVVGALTTDWVELRELTREASTFTRQIAEQRETIDAFNRRVVELRQEMVGWRELHARIWEPFGPELFFFQAEDGIRDYKVTGVQTCALPICFFPDVIFHAQEDAGKRYLVDFWVKPGADKLEIVDTRIRKAPRREGTAWTLQTRQPDRKSVV